MSKAVPSRLVVFAAIGLGSTLVAGVARSRRSRIAETSQLRVAPWQPLIDAGRRASARHNELSSPIELDEINLSDVSMDQADAASENALIAGSVSAPNSDV